MATINLTDYPCLRQLAWQRPVQATIGRAEALAIYERNWRFVDETAMEPSEREFLDGLIEHEGRGVFVV